MWFVFQILTGFGAKTKYTRNLSRYKVFYTDKSLAAIALVASIKSQETSLSSASLIIVWYPTPCFSASDFAQAMTWGCNLIETDWYFSASLLIGLPRWV